MTSPLAGLAEQFGFESWRDAPAAAETLFVWRFTLFGGELAGWTPHRIQSVIPSDGPPTVLSVWRPADTTRAVLVSIVVHELPSRQAARAHLLRTLGEFEGPLLERRDGPGEVAFGVGVVSLVFVRANLVLLVRSVEREPVAVAPVAIALDGYLRERPEPVDRGGPTIGTLRRADAGGGAAGRAVRIAVEATEPRGRPVWYKMFATNGEVRAENGALAFVPAGAGPREVTVVAVGPEGAGRSEVLRLE